MKYLTLIRAIALLHQHQRPGEDASSTAAETLEYIEVTPRRHRAGEPPRARGARPQPRRAAAADAAPSDAAASRMVRAGAEREALRRRDVRFTPPRGARGARSWGDTQLKVHLGAPGGARVPAGAPRRPRPDLVYELLYDGAAEEAAGTCSGLLDVADLDDADDYDGASLAEEGGQSGPSRGQGGAEWGAGFGWRKAAPGAEGVRGRFVRAAAASAAYHGNGAGSCCNGRAYGVRSGGAPSVHARRARLPQAGRAICATRAACMRRCARYLEYLRRARLHRVAGAVHEPSATSATSSAGPTRAA